MKVLIIDDEINIAKPLGLFEALEARAEVLYAESERNGLVILETAQVDVILMDGNLGFDFRGDNIWGADVVKRLRATGCRTRICMFSSDEKMNAEGMRAGADGAFKKDYGDEEMPEKLVAHLDALMFRT